MTSKAYCGHKEPCPLGMSKLPLIKSARRARWRLVTILFSAAQPRERAVGVSPFPGKRSPLNRSLSQSNNRYVSSKSARILAKFACGWRKTPSACRRTNFAGVNAALPSESLRSNRNWTKIILASKSWQISSSFRPASSSLSRIWRRLPNSIRSARPSRLKRKARWRKNSPETRLIQCSARAARRSSVCVLASIKSGGSI